MARVLDKIKLIDGSRKTLKLFARITDLWFIGIPEKSEQVEMVIVDYDVCFFPFFLLLYTILLTIQSGIYILCIYIHVVCKQDQLKSSKADLKENLTYVMHNFKVMKNDCQFKICDHEYKLSFTRVTVVRQSDTEHLTFRKFRFVDFSTVITRDFQTGLLVGKIVCNLCIDFD